ncbi:hypothetical protein BKI52_13400 [marine bacterium AO1-C]|nr:hypothetical protein BKI52_13400 [marine bacterium AO1-C]
MYKITTFIILGILAWTTQLQAQEVREKTLDYKVDGGVYLDLALGNSITVKGWDKNKIYIKTTVEINGGRLNKALEMTYDKWGDQIRISSELNQSILKTGKRGDCGDRYDRYQSVMNGRRYYACYSIEHEIYMPKNARLKLKAINPKVTLDNLYGDLRINTVNGSINMVTPQIKPKQNLEFRTVNGRIDFTIPASASTEVEMSTVNGHIYSSFKPKPKKKNGMYRIGGRRFNQNIRMRLGDGSAFTELKTVNGRIYLRKGK